MTDESSGLPYYYQTKTGETVWERPSAFVIPLGILQARVSQLRTLRLRLSHEPYLNDRIQPSPVVYRSNIPFQRHLYLRPAQIPRMPRQPQTAAGNPRTAVLAPTSTMVLRSQSLRSRPSHKTVHMYVSVHTRPLAQLMDGTHQTVRQILQSLGRLYAVQHQARSIITTTVPPVRASRRLPTNAVTLLHPSQVHRTIQTIPHPVAHQRKASHAYRLHRNIVRSETERRKEVEVPGRALGLGFK